MKRPPTSAEQQELRAYILTYCPVRGCVPVVLRHVRVLLALGVDEAVRTGGRTGIRDVRDATNYGSVLAAYQRGPGI